MKKPGERVDRYVIEAVLGRGGMGEVYEAHDTRLGRRVALKLIRETGDEVKNQRMVREARTAAAFEHPNVVVIYDVGEAEGSPYIAMELVRGKPLRAFVGDAGLSLGRKLRWLVDSARALAAAHRAGLVHRDVKPDNVMVRSDGAIKVLDFGIARKKHAAVDPSAPTAANTSGIVTLTERGVVVGTPRYSAPEQLRSEDVDGRADQFSWGVMAYEVLSGVSPWSAEDALGLLSQILSGEVRPLAELVPELPAEVEAAIARAIAKKADARYPTIDEAADAIEPFADAAGPSRRDSSMPLSGASGESGAVDTARAHTVGTPAVRVLRRTARVGMAVLASIGGLLIVLIIVAAFKGNVRLSSAKKGAEPLVVDALGCEEAKLEGELPKGADVVTELARAIGIGACARLATDVGVDWSVPNATKKLEVRAKLAEASAEVVLRVDDREATATGLTPVDAIVAATVELKKQLAPPPMAPADIAAWGAKDEASARRIERVWRRLVLNLGKNDEATVKELIETDPESPWSHVIQVLIGPAGTEKVKTARDRALSLVDKLPAARAHGLRALMLIYRSSADLKEAMKLLRQAYSESPEDPDIAGLYAAVAISTAPEEGFAVVDRLYARFPTRSIVPLENAFFAAADRDLERNQKYLGWLRKTFPEALAWSSSVQQAVLKGDFDQARTSLEFARRFGLSGTSSDSAGQEWNGAWVELAAMQPKAARELAARMHADPRLGISTTGASVTISSYFMEGRINDGEAVLWREQERQRSAGSPLEAAVLVASGSRTRRWLGRPPVELERLESAEKAIAASPETSPSTVAFVRTEAALARSAAAGPKGKAVATAALKELEEYAEKASLGERNFRDSIRVVTLPLLRAARGDREAARSWLELDRASFGAKRRSALDAALVLEATGDRAGAEKAYLLALDPVDMKREGLQAVLAVSRLAALYRAQQRDADAAKYDELLSRLWSHADPGVREAALKLR